MRTSKWAVLAYVAIILFGILAALPNVLPVAVQQQYAAFLPVNPVTLGLDLKGARIWFSKSMRPAFARPG